MLIEAPEKTTIAIKIKMNTVFFTNFIKSVPSVCGATHQILVSSFTSLYANSSRNGLTKLLQARIQGESFRVNKVSQMASC